MDSSGNIKQFANQNLAALAGFDTALTDEEAKVLTPVPTALRHAFLRHLRAEDQAKAANTSKRREKNKAACKARRLRRDR
jgi:hypothetical protein